MTETPKRFILIDDDPLNNLLTKMILKKSFEEVLIIIFTVPEEGLQFMKSESSVNSPEGKTILFLDLNMPTISGWEFLKEFELFNDDVKERYLIYILSSSVDPNDINRAKEYPLIIDFIEKPLNKTVLAKILG